MANTKQTRFEIVANGKTYALQSKQLSVNLQKMVAGLAVAKKGTWQYAKALFNIKRNKYYEPDFESMTAFASEFGISKTVLSQAVNGVRVMVEVLVKQGYDENLSLTNAYELSKLDDKTLKDFIKWVHDKALRFDCMSQLTLLGLKKDYLEIIDGKKTETDDNKTEDGKKTETDGKKSSVKASIDGNAVLLTIDGIGYRVPLDIVKKYEVKK